MPELILTASLSCHHDGSQTGCARSKSSRALKIPIFRLQGLPSLVTAAWAPSQAFPSSSNAVRVYGMTVCYLTQISDSRFPSTSPCFIVSSTSTCTSQSMPFKRTSCGSATASEKAGLDAVPACACMLLLWDTRRRCALTSSPEAAAKRKGLPVQDTRRTCSLRSRCRKELSCFQSRFHVDHLGCFRAGTPVRECPELQACIPLSEVQIAENYGVLQLPGHPASYVGAVGVCTGTMDSGYHLPNSTAVPPPM